MSTAIQQAWQRCEHIDDPDARGRILFELIPCFPHSTRGPLYAAVARLARDIPGDMERVDFLLDTLGGPAYDSEVDAIRRDLTTSADVTDPVASALMTAAFRRHRASVTQQLLSTASSLPDDESTYRVLEAVPHYDLRQRELRAYLTVVESLGEPNLRARAALPVARSSSGRLLERVIAIAEAAEDLLRNKVHTEVEAFVADVDAPSSRQARRGRNTGIVDPEARALSQLTVLSLGASNEENELTAGAVFDAIEEVDTTDVRLDLISRYRYSLPGVAPWCGDRALRLVLNVPSQRLRARGLATIAGLAKPSEVLAAADALEDPWAVATVMFAYRYGHPLDDRRAEAWFSRLRSAALLVAEPAPRARFLTLLATVWDEARPDLLAEALRSSETIAQPWAQVQAMDRVFDLSRPTTEMMQRALRVAGQEPVPQRRARALARMSRYLNADEREPVMDAALTELWDSVPERGLAAAVRHVVQDGQLELW